MPARRALTVDDWNRLNRLLEHGLAVPAAERVAWLKQLPADSAHLRELLTDLLTESEATGFAADTEPPTTVARLAGEALAAMRREREGDRIGPWQLERLLAEGGMGTVWVAQRADGLMRRTAALKLPRAEWVDRGLRERIERERAILARLQHPYIAVLYDAGVTNEGRPYMALEYVEGKPIDAYCRESAKELSQVLKLMVQVVRTVAYAHSQLVIHRDLKPSNVLVMADATPKLLDFGISKVIEGEAQAVDQTALTRLAGRPLTPAYAAPEQLLGLPVTVAADVYALGVMLFELTSGARLYRAATPAALEEEILRGDLRRPSEAATDKARAKALRGDLDAIISTALKRSPEARYDTAAALADDLERYLSDQPVRAQPDSRAYRLRKFISRNRLPVAAGAAVVVAVAVGLGAALWQADRARQQAEEARNQAERATALNTFVLSLIQQFDPRASQASKAADLALLNSIEQRIEAEFKGSADQLLQLRVTVGEAYRERGQHVAARRVYRRAIAEAERSLPADHFGLLQARVAAASHAIETVDDEALQSLDATIGQLRQRGQAGIRPLIDALIARAKNKPGAWDSSYADAREAYDLATRELGAGSPHQLRGAGQLTFILVRRSGSKRPEADRAEEAFKVVESALAAARGNPAIREGNVDLLNAELRYGELLCKFRSADEGMRRLWDVAALGRRYHGDDSLQVEVAHYLLGDCLWERGDPDAVGLKATAYAMAVARAEHSPWVFALLANEVAVLECNFGRADECAEFAAKASLHAAAMPAGKIRSRMLSVTGATRILALTAQGKPDEAEALASQLLVEPHCCEQSLQMFRSEALRLAGRPDEALRAAEKALALARAKNVDDLELFQMLAQRGSAELDLREPTQAMASFEEAMRSAPSADAQTFGNGWAAFSLLYGRALLANNRPVEALEALRQSYGLFLGHDAKSVWAAEAEYWFGQAWIANGDAKRGRWMVAEAKRALATSPFKPHRALAQLPPADDMKFRSNVRIETPVAAAR